MQSNEFRVPVAILTKTDLVRLIRETHDIDDFMEQSKIRHSKTISTLPRTTVLLEETAKVNGLSLLVVEDRATLRQYLEQVRDEAPVLHISFGSVPGPHFMERLMSWLRQEIHPQVLLQIGLQPSIAVGCTIRSTNKFFDFSLRKTLMSKQPELLQKLRG